MSLILGVSSGDVLYLGTNPLKVVSTTDDKRNISVEYDGKGYNLNDSSYTQIAPNIYLCVGKAKSDTTFNGSETLPRLAIDAPRDVKILRDKHLKPRVNTKYDRNYN